MQARSLLYVSLHFQTCRILTVLTSKSANQGRRQQGAVVPGPHFMFGSPVAAYIQNCV